MLAFRTTIMSFSVLVMALSVQAFAPQEKTRVATLGVIGIKSVPDPNHVADASEISLVDLSAKDPKTATPYLYSLLCFKNCSFQVGGTYQATVSGDYPTIDWILVNRSELKVGIYPPDPVMGLDTLVCADRLSPKGGHWEWDSSKEFARCEPGAKDNIKWKSAQETARSAGSTNIPQCHDYLGFHDELLKVLITVKPTYNMQWKFDEAPSVVAEELLADLNSNSRRIKFTEASGELPHFYINVIMTETNEGTRQDSATVEVRGVPVYGGGTQTSVTLFSERSGESPFTSWRDAINHLGTNMLKWFEGGWHSNPPCIRPNGSVRTQ